MNAEAIEYDRHLDGRHNRRLGVQDRTLAKWERDEQKAAPLIGELSSGKFYVFPVGGKYFESHSHTECVQHLAKKGYLR